MIDRGFGRVNGISQHGNDAKKSTRHGVGGGESGLAINQENQVIKSNYRLQIVVGLCCATICYGIGLLLK